MYIQQINRDFCHQAIEEIQSDSFGRKIMSDKSEILAFKVFGLSLSATMILKQEAISVGGDFATPRDCILAKDKYYDGILFGSVSQINRIIKKCKIQPFGLKEFAFQLQAFLKPRKFQPKIMAVVNVTPDSFYQDSRQSVQGAIDRITALLQTEVDIIDIGGASSRPGSDLIDPMEEKNRLKEIFHFIASNQLFKQKEFSIDTYNVEVAREALKNGFCWINDVSGFADEKMMYLAKEYQAKVFLMHTRGTPKEMQQLTSYQNLFEEIDLFFKQKISKLLEYKIGDIVLDIGFGFAKNTQQNLTLIKHLGHFKKYGYPILVGASRKRTIQEIIKKEAKNALSGTLALHLLALENGADILRVHDEMEHLDLLKIYKAYQDA
ncbi:MULTISPECIES: dihydropteroate synthase [unclassified Helicobacter]|uniref:dihydropteroate synthase n=1 Tax=unclassified Helicobacter TaxID=2593540 RepID=UPI000CF02BE1|nr:MULTISPECIES: dihydropteroate synthase [unclassified Helicobacter]